MGAVTLNVADLDAMTRYYSQAVTLRVLSHDHDRVVLGRGGEPAVILVHEPSLRHAPSGGAGLFHTAIVFDTRAALATAVLSTMRYAPGTFAGSADHLVSEAFYFTDPEGNGVELYFDRERTTWSWVHGQVAMDTLHLDPRAYLTKYLPADEAADPGAHADGRVGHIHLSVGNVAVARDFYVNRLGFDVTATLGSAALFVSAGGYHHHMAMNVWNSRGAGRRGRTLGLAEVGIVVPSREDVEQTSDRLGHFGVAVRDDGRAISFADPWNNTVTLTPNA
ncbi:VOC family protein [Rarobacter incanus]|nr:VOC family protein [Rarobacter incanus]